MIVLVSKTSEPKGSVGSNPTHSAFKMSRTLQQGLGSFFHSHFLGFEHTTDFACEIRAVSFDAKGARYSEIPPTPRISKPTPIQGLDLFFIASCFPSPFSFPFSVILSAASLRAKSKDLPTCATNQVSWHFGETQGHCFSFTLLLKK